jgi:site-specific recombinase XerD
VHPIAFLGELWGKTHMEENTFELPDLQPGHSIVLRRKGPGQVWTARIKAPSIAGSNDFGRIERSTRLRELEQAKREALKLYHQALIGKSQVEARAKKAGRRSFVFKDAVKAFLESEKEKVGSGERSASQYDRERVSLLRHYAPFLGEKSLHEIDKRLLSTYRTQRSLNKHRQDESEEIVYQRAGKTLRYSRLPGVPTAETLRRERTDFKALMEWCVEQGWLIQKPEYPVIKGVAGRRQSFSPEAIQHLQHVSLARIRSAKSPKRKREWLFCHLRMMFVYVTGCRPQEVAKLRHQDMKWPVKDRNGDLTTSISIDKTITKYPKHARTVITSPKFDSFSYTISHGDLIGADWGDYIFVGPNRKRLGPCNKPFRSLLKAALQAYRHEIPELEANLKNPYYSLRHTFITERLYEGMDVYELARLSGTSVEMIEAHYSHVKTEIERSKKVTTPGPYVVTMPEDIWEGVLLFHEMPERPPQEDEPVFTDGEYVLTPAEEEMAEYEASLPNLRSRHD